MECQNWKENLALHKGCQNGKTSLAKLTFELLKTPKLPKMASEHSSVGHVAQMHEYLIHHCSAREPKSFV